MTRDHIKEVVTKYLARAIDVDAESIDTSESMKDLGANSLDIVEVVSSAMRELRVRVPRSELDTLEDIDALIDLLDEHAQAKAEGVVIARDLTGRRVLITGGTRGIGLATGLAFTRCGAQCALTYRWGTAEDDDLLAKFAETGGPAPILVQADVGRDEDTEALMEALKEHWDGVDVFVSNASNALRIGSLDDYSARGLEKSIRYSAWPLVGYTVAIEAAFGSYPKHVIAMSSDGPDHYSIGYDFVAASKAVLETLTRYLSYRLLEHGTKVNAIRSRSVKTESFDSTFGKPLRDFGLRFATEEHFIPTDEVAGAALALCSGWLDAVNGQVLTVDRGTAFSDNLMRLFTERDKLPL